jgi:hypothetical protein
MTITVPRQADSARMERAKTLIVIAFGLLEAILALGMPILGIVISAIGTGSAIVLYRRTGAPRYRNLAVFSGMLSLLVVVELLFLVAASQESSVKPG